MLYRRPSGHTKRETQRLKISSLSSASPHVTWHPQCSPSSSPSNPSKPSPSSSQSPRTQASPPAQQSLPPSNSPNNILYNHHPHTPQHLPRPTLKAIVLPCSHRQQPRRLQAPRLHVAIRLESGFESWGADHVVAGEEADGWADG